MKATEHEMLEEHRLANAQLVQQLINRQTEIHRLRNKVTEMMRDWMHGTEVICDRCDTGWSGPVAGEYVRFATCPTCLFAELERSKETVRHLTVALATAAGSLRQNADSWDVEGYSLNAQLAQEEYEAAIDAHVSWGQV